MTLKTDSFRISLLVKKKKNTKDRQKETNLNHFITLSISATTTITTKKRRFGKRTEKILRPRNWIDHATALRFFCWHHPIFAGSKHIVIIIISIQLRKHYVCG